ncbi:MAG: nucleotidyltransferase family protein [Pseudomonadota bacterium]
MTAGVGVLLLAAGRARRFGSDKRFATLSDGRSMFETTLDTLQRSTLPLRVCVAPEDTAGLNLLAERSVEALVCDRAEEGMGAVLAQGAAAVADWHGVLVALADMPWISVNTYQRVAAGLGGRRIHRPVWRGRGGHPMGFGRAYFDQLISLSGDVGGKDIVRRHKDNIVDVVLEDVGILQDVDRPDQLVRRSS